MKLATASLDNQQRELRDNTETNLKEYTPHKFAFLNKFWQSLVKGIVSGKDLRVWQKSDRSGNTEWHAYDPATGRSTCVASDAEMRMWIEQQYYQ
ncbi:hypothetical protein [Argonema antarcticum]|uniref:hypothetical protein n=1 Tax=Argonema antarcticum TaxID=2942763 RepID=UPI0020119548|nr:hypothetical protein [Argonema antarcticum]MCL1471899.1 hypothetical protein [Argonema antarcticum A004/B2]